MVQQKLVDQISLNFPELFIIRKYVKIRFKNKLTMLFSQFLRSRDQKYCKNWAEETVFVYILGFIFYGVSRAKIDLHNKYMI